MHIRTRILMVAIIVLGLLAIEGTVGAMAMTHSGFMANGYGYGNGMMPGTSGYQGMMGGQYNHGSMMRRYQQHPARPGIPVTDVTQLNIQHFAYQQMSMQVRAGTTVTWTNQDNVSHSVTFKNGVKDSGLLSPGQTFSYTFNTPGMHQYSCTVHPYMVATVTVIS